jgi:hypothetical protein
MKDFMDYRPGDRVRLVKGINLETGTMGTVAERCYDFEAGEHIFYLVMFDRDPLRVPRATHFAQIELISRCETRGGTRVVLSDESIKSALRVLARALGVDKL